MDAVEVRVRMRVQLRAEAAFTVLSIFFLSTFLYFDVFYFGLFLYHSDREEQNKSLILLIILLL